MLELIVIIAALILFLCDAFNVPSWRINRTALGLALFAVLVLLGHPFV